MNCRQARQTFEQLIEAGASSQDLPELEGHLRQCPACRAWCDRERRLVQRLEQWDASPLPAGFVGRILSRLPGLPLGELDLVVRAIVRAWQEPDFRETLRSDPRRTLEEEGVTLPPDLRVIVVPPDEAALPTRQLLALPLPDPGEAPQSEAVLRARLASTAAAVLVNPESALQVVAGESTGLAQWLAGVLARLRRTWNSFLFSLSRPAPRRMLVPALAVAATLLLAVGLLYVVVGDQVPTTPGAAIGAGSWLIGGALLAVVVLAAIWAWRRRKQ